MSATHDGLGFTGLVDLAAASFGGLALWSTDDFFAGHDRMLLPGRGVFLPDEYTEQGKWMDGWESMRTRRRSAMSDRDECIVRLGQRGVIRAVDIDTNHFLGNHPPYAALLGTTAPFAATADSLKNSTWTELLAPSPLRPGSQNLFGIPGAAGTTHVKLVIYPDGGVARLRVWGDVLPGGDRPQEFDDATKPLVKPGERDLAALLNGGRVLACSDMFFGPMHNLLLPGRAPTMGDGWETRRRRQPGNEWILIGLGEPGAIGMVEIDTNHFKGNFPDDALIQAVHAPGARLPELISDGVPWRELLPSTALAPHDRRFLRSELAKLGPVTHLRLSIYPDGGVSRLRAWGIPA